MSDKKCEYKPGTNKSTQKSVLVVVINRVFSPPEKGLQLWWHTTVTVPFLSTIGLPYGRFQEVCVGEKAITALGNRHTILSP